MMFLDCPAYLDAGRTARCGLPAEARYRFTMRSTDGPLESAMIRCPAGHWFNGPLASLTLEAGDSQDLGTATKASHASDNRAGATGRRGQVMIRETGAAGLRWLWELVAESQAREYAKRTQPTGETHGRPSGGRHMRASLALRTADARQPVNTAQRPTGGAISPCPIQKPGCGKFSAPEQENPR